jgi:hypothetical protein
LASLTEYPLPNDVKAGDGWTHDQVRNLWCCGDLFISLDPTDPTRFKVSVIDGGEEIFGGRITPSGYREDDFGAFETILTEASYGNCPSAGLEPWLERAQELADAEYERIERERQDAINRLPGRTAAELLAQKDTQTDFLVDGLIKRGWTTKVGGREKQAGKGTFICYCLGKLERGERTVFGPEVPAPRVTALIFSEEPADSMREKVEASGLQHARIVFGFELTGLPWETKVETLVELAVTEGHEILFVDNASRSAGIKDEGGVEFARAVETLQDACREAGLTLIIDVHHKKGRDDIENKTRGGTGVQGAVDINVEIERVGGRASRQRRLTAFGRVRSTQWVKVIELSEDGREYALTSEAEEIDAAELTQLADQMKLRECAKPVTVKEFAELLGVTPDTARRRLRNLVDNGTAVENRGSGKRASTFEPSALT